MDVVGAFGFFLSTELQKDLGRGSLVGKLAILTQHVASWVPFGCLPAIVGLSMEGRVISKSTTIAPTLTGECPAEQRGPQEGDEVRERCLGRHGASHSVLRPQGSAAAAALQTWLGEWRGCLWMFPSISVRSAHSGDVGRVSSMHMSYFDCICSYWLRSELDESARA